MALMSRSLDGATPASPLRMALLRPSMNGLASPSRLKDLMPPSVENSASPLIETPRKLDWTAIVNTTGEETPAFSTRKKPLNSGQASHSFSRTPVPSSRACRMPPSVESSALPDSPKPKNVTAPENVSEISEAVICSRAKPMMLMSSSPFSSNSSVSSRGPILESNASKENMSTKKPTKSSIASNGLGNTPDSPPHAFVCNRRRASSSPVRRPALSCIPTLGISPAECIAISFVEFGRVGMDGNHES
mmetsp:Transcript_48696/g.127251  ORF Transcript_48696/g.127251 Transcript_48696/m.127251 type:complete len:247 (-) Transcript_48696:2985-3725(-)